MSDEKVNREASRRPVRDPKGFSGYPSARVREGIRRWGSPEDWQIWRAWEEFIRGDSDEEPVSLADWLPEHELVERERLRAAGQVERRRRVRLNLRAEFVMREQISALRHALGRGYVRSPLRFAHEGYPGAAERVGAAKGKGMWGGLAWEQNHRRYAQAWDAFMKGEVDGPPRRRGPKENLRPAGWAVELENKGYVGNDPPEGDDRWLDGEEPDLPRVKGTSR